MADCSKCLRTDVKCCFTCKKDSDKCQVWHCCGSDCPEHESRIKTNADKIRSMNDEELADYLYKMTLASLTVVEVDSREIAIPKLLKWLQSEAE